MAEVGMKVSGMSQRDAAAMVAAVRAAVAVRGGWLTRYLVLDDAGLESLGATGALGRHWTSDGSGMSLDGLRIPPEADDAWRFYEVLGRIDGEAAIDWESTVAARFAIPWEREVVLRQDAEVTVGGVWIVDESARRRGPRVRDDLRGVRLRAAEHGFPLTRIP